jgi:hypothetical protein
MQWGSVCNGEVRAGESGRVNPKFGFLGRQVYQTGKYWWESTLGQLSLKDDVN